MTAIMLSCWIAAAPVPKNWKPPIEIDSWACGWKVTRGEDCWWFSLNYSEAEMKAFIEAEDRAKADPLYRKREP